MKKWFISNEVDEDGKLYVSVSIQCDNLVQAMGVIGVVESIEKGVIKN